MKSLIFFILTIVITRVSMLTLYGVYYDENFASKTDFAYNDLLHHYQLGLLFLVLYFFNTKRFKYLLPTGAGLVVEEYAVIMYQLDIPHFHYLSVPENTIMLLLVFIFICVLSFKYALSKKQLAD